MPTEAKLFVGEEDLRNAEGDAEYAPFPEDAEREAANDNEEIDPSELQREAANDTTDQAIETLVEQVGGDAEGWERVNGRMGEWVFDGEKIYNPDTGELYTDLSDPEAALTMRDAARHWNEGGGAHYLESTWKEETDEGVVVSAIQLIRGEKRADGTWDIGWAMHKTEIKYHKEEDEKTEEYPDARAEPRRLETGEDFAEPMTIDSAGDDLARVENAHESTVGDAEPAEICGERVESEPAPAMTVESVAMRAVAAAPAPTTTGGYESFREKAAPDSWLVELLKPDASEPFESNDGISPQPNNAQEPARRGAADASIEPRRGTESEPAADIGIATTRAAPESRGERPARTFDRRLPEPDASMEIGIANRQKKERDDQPEAQETRRHPLIDISAAPPIERGPETASDDPSAEASKVEGRSEIGIAIDRARAMHAEPEARAALVVTREKITEETEHATSPAARTAEPKRHVPAEIIREPYERPSSADAARNERQPVAGAAELPRERFVQSVGRRIAAPRPGHVREGMRFEGMRRTRFVPPRYAAGEDARPREKVRTLNGIRMRMAA